MQAKAGSRDAFSELTRYFRPRLVALLQKRYGHSTPDAEDMAQEALSRAFQHMERFDPQYCFSTWLFTIAIRLSCDQARGAARERKRQQAWREVERIKQTERAEAHGVAVQEVERGEETMDAVALWKRAKETLKPQAYEALWMRYGEGIPIGEIANRMGKTSIGVRVLLHRARHALQGKWGKR